MQRSLNAARISEYFSPWMAAVPYPDAAFKLSLARIVLTSSSHWAHDDISRAPRLAVHRYFFCCMDSVVTNRLRSTCEGIPS